MAQANAASNSQTENLLRPKAQGSERRLKTKTSNLSDSSKSSLGNGDKPLSTTTVRVTDLPGFTQVNGKWKDTYLATLQRCAYNSADPFRNFVRSSPVLLAQVQECVDVVYPEVDYVVASQGDAILLLVSGLPFLSSCHEN